MNVAEYRSTKALRALRDIFAAGIRSLVHRTRGVDLEECYFEFASDCRGRRHYTNCERRWRRQWHLARRRGLSGKWFAWEGAAPGEHRVPTYHLRRELRG
jgi:hypothetical protein